MTANLLTLTREKRAFPMKRHLMPATTLTTLKKIALTLLCCTVLMVSAALGQIAGTGTPTNPSSGSTAPPPKPGPNDPIIGLPADPGTGNCFPFGCAYNGYYQQVYTSSQFSGPITITGLNFYNTQYGESATTAMNSGTWTISLSTTSANWNTLSSVFNNNIGPDNTQVFSGNLTQPWAFPDTLSIVLTTPFTYNPTSGNLLMTVVATGTSDAGGEIFFDTNGSNDDEDNGDTIMGRVFCYGGVSCGSSGDVDSGFGLVTGLTSAVVSQETLTLTEMGLGAGTVTDTYNTSSPPPPAAISCMEAGEGAAQTGVCSESDAPGAMVTLTATPNPSAPNGGPSTFGGWGGACASFGTSTTCSLTMNSAQNVTADFVAPPIVVPLTLTPGTNVTGTATFCPNGSSPCTDPNGHEFSILIPVVNSGFTLKVTATEVDPNGLCPASQVPLGGKSSDFACRFVSFFNYGIDTATGDTIVPLCYPYSNGNCIHYNLSLTGEPGGGEPDPSLYGGGVYWQIAFNNDTFTPPAGSYWTGSTPRLLDDPDVDEFSPPLPYGTNCSTAMLVNGSPTSPPIYCQFDADITTFFNAAEGADATIGGKTPQANDVVVAFLPTSPGSDPVRTPPTPVAPTISGSCVNGCVVSSPAIAFNPGMGGTFAVTATGYPTPTLTESGALPSGLTFNTATGTISGTPAVGSGGNYPITFTAANGVLPNAVASFTLTVSFLEISPTSVNFGTVYFDTIGVQFVTLTNDGPTSITISSARITTPGNALGEFGDITFCDPLIWAMPGTLPAGKSCTIGVGLLAFMKIFSPTASTATLTITDSAAGSPQRVPLTAQVIDPQAALSTHFLNFGREKEYNTSAAKTVTLTNTGATPLSLTSIAISGSFALSSGTTCASGGMVNPSASCIFNVTFTPESKGSFIGQVTITDNAFFSPQVITLAGTGD